VDIFFRELGMPAPDRHLDVGSGSHAEQTAKVMVAFGKVLTDAISDLLFVTEESGARNLRNEGVPKERVFLVGNVMIGTLRRNLSRIEDGGRTRSAR